MENQPPVLIRILNGQPASDKDSRATRGQQTQLKPIAPWMIKGYQGVFKALAHPVLFSLIMIQASAEGKKVLEAQCHELK